MRGIVVFAFFYRFLASAFLSISFSLVTCSMIANPLEDNVVRKITAVFLLISFSAQITRILNVSRGVNFSNSRYRAATIFWSKLRSVIRMCFPKIFSLEVLGLLFECYLIFLRSSLTVKLATIVSQAGKHLISNKKALIAGDLMKLAFLSVPGTICHVAVWYVRSLVIERMKENLYESLSNSYFSGHNIFHVASSALADPEQRFAVDSIKFCNTFVNLFESLLMPVINIATLSLELSKSGGKSLPGLLFSYYLCVSSVKSILFPNVAFLMSVSQEREAKLRATHNNLVHHAEEIGFYCGEQREKEHAEQLLLSIIKNEEKIKIIKWILSVFTSIFTKYGGMCLGYAMCGMIALSSSKCDEALLAEKYFKTAALTMPLLKSLHKIFAVHLKIAALSGSVGRVGELKETLDEVRKVNEQNRVVFQENYTRGDLIEFSHVDIRTPENNTLIHDFSLVVKQGVHVLITGDNGSGKSAIVRALTEVWPICCGTITKPREEDIFVVPQRSYFVRGSLKTQLTYPTPPELVDDTVVYQYCKLMGLDSAVERIGGLHAVDAWYQVLSGGEKQRVGFVRVLVNKPIFVILDDCSSAIAVDDEQSIYYTLQQAGMTLLTISRRDLLKELHSSIVEIDGKGGYQIAQSGAAISA